MRRDSHTAAEIALAALAGIGSFGLAAVLLDAVDSDVEVVLLIVPYLAAVLAIARYWGVAYAVPVAMVGLLAYDWYYLPPTHPLEFPDSANLVDLLAYIAVAVLIGQLAARGARRAVASERAHGAIAAEQAALRRVATLVATGVPARELFAAVAEEAGMLLEVDGVGIARYESDEVITLVAAWSAPGYDPPSFDRAKLEGRSISAEVLRTKQVARIDEYKDTRSAVGAPIVVEGRLWGPMVVWSTREPLPTDVAARLTHFAALVATAIANAEARTEVERLAEEQAALRRVATLVARGVAPDLVFAAVAREVALLLDVDATHIGRYEPDDTTVGVGSWSREGHHAPVGTRAPLDGTSVSSLVYETGRPARLDSYDEAVGSIAEMLHRDLGIRSSVGAPIVVEGRLWGVVIASSREQDPLPAGTESRIAAFTELVATAISNTEARAEVAASRARIVAADDTRRRFERDLHDGVQQRLVSLTLDLRGAEAVATQGPDEIQPRLARVATGLTDVLDDLREVSRGIHPAILSEGGLGPALKALVRRSAVPVKLDLSVVERLDESVEVAAYYVVSEALTNSAKHAQASVTTVHATAGDRFLELTIRDDGVGGADPTHGSGLTGLRDRVEALGDKLSVVSPLGEGTSLSARLPIETA